MRNKELTLEERIKIETLLGEKKSLRYIANCLNRGKSTISDEVKKNKGKNEYDAKKAQTRKYFKRYRAKNNCNVLTMNPDTQRQVEKGLLAGSSPETISSRLKKQSGIKYASGKSIRKFISKRRPNWEIYLFWKRNKKKGGPKKNKINSKLEDRIFIEERPKTKGIYGHWEGDFIISKHNSFVVLVLVEKLSRFTLLRLLPNRSNKSVNQAILEMLESYTVKSLTLDNDIAFQKHKELEERLKAPIYFCHPYHSWEKGLVENMNRWIRTLIPKKTNLALVTKQGLVEIQNWLNYNPRLCLDGNSSYEKIMKYQNNLVVFTLFTKLPVRIEG